MNFFSFFKEERPTLVDQAFEDIRTMLEGGRRMFSVATAFLLDNEALTANLHALDFEINEGEQNLRRALLKHLTVNPRQEMIFSLKLISIVTEAERIGDLAKSLEEAGRMARRPRMGDVAVRQRELRDRILQMFDRVREGFIEGDASAARELMYAHEKMKDDIAQHLHELADRDDLAVNESVVYTLSARLMSRVSSHLSNIASAVVTSFDQLRCAPTWVEESQAA